MKILCIQHVNFEAPGNILKWAKERNHSVVTLLAYQSPVFPEVSDFDLLIIMGGPMGVADTFQNPWLVAEKDFLRKSLETGKKIMGVCLGSQLLAEALGGKIVKNQNKEIGYHPITITEAGSRSSFFQNLPLTLDVFHWHGEVFSLPPQAINLAQSKITPSQAFIWNNQALGIQFHPEVSDETLESMIRNCKADLEDAPWIQSVEAMRKMVQNDSISYALLCQLLQNLVE